MTSKTVRALKEKDAEVMIVSKELADQIRELKDKLKTSSLDVVSAALELLKNSVNKEIVIRDPATGKEITIRALTDIK